MATPLLDWTEASLLNKVVKEVQISL
ncbi:hypothetical protein [Ammoniphilus sp. 3BR4]